MKGFMGDGWRDPLRWCLIACAVSITAYLIALAGMIAQAIRAGWS